jgi:hypothetical protein
VLPSLHFCTWEFMVVGLTPKTRNYKSFTEIRLILAVNALAVSMSNRELIRTQALKMVMSSVGQ